MPKMKKKEGNYPSAPRLQKKRGNKMELTVKEALSDIPLRFLREEGGKNIPNKN